jgi:hypothetical protein
MRLTKNIQQEQTRFQEFSTNLLAPVMAQMLLNETGYHEPIVASQRSVQEVYGFAASECFVLMFKRVVRGGRSDKTGISYKSTWVPNPEGLTIYLNWIEKTNEKTCRSLLASLKQEEVQPLEWNREKKGWISSILARAARQAKADIEKIENINWALVKTAITKQGELK